MGNNQTKIAFGSINPELGAKARPGYYFSKKIKSYQGVPIEVQPDEHQFKKLKYGYAKSNQRVFYQGIPIPDANPVTFDVINRSEIATKVNAIHTKQFVKLNTVLGMDFNGNEQRLYHKGTLIV
jgi:hypothetical protein